MKILRMLAAICMIGAMVFTFAACGGTGATEAPTTEATEAPTTEATEEYVPTIPVATFKAFVGTWYADGSSANYRILINEDATWSFIDPSGDVLFGGSLYVNEENVSITLYDPDGIQCLDLKLEEAGKVYVEIYMESLMDSLSTNYFLNEITNNEAISTPIEDDGISSDELVEEAVTPEENLSGEESAS